MSEIYQATIGLGAPLAPRPLAATLPGLAWMNLPEFPPVSSGFHPAQALGGASVLQRALFAAAMFRSGNPLSLLPKGAGLFLSEDWLGGVESLCEAEDLTESEGACRGSRRHRDWTVRSKQRSIAFGARGGAPNGTSRRRDTEAKGRGGPR